MTTYEIIKELRIRKKLSQKSIAEKVGISQQAFALMEQGKRKIDFDFFITTLNALECTTQEKILCLNQLLDINETTNLNSLEYWNSLYSLDMLKEIENTTYRNIFAMCGWNIDDTLETGDIIIFKNTNSGKIFTISLDKYYEFQGEISRYIIFLTQKLEESND